MGRTAILRWKKLECLEAGASRDLDRGEIRRIGVEQDHQHLRAWECRGGEHIFSARRESFPGDTWKDTSSIGRLACLIQVMLDISKQSAAEAYERARMVGERVD